MTLINDGAKAFHCLVLAVLFSLLTVEQAVGQAAQDSDKALLAEVERHGSIRVIVTLANIDAGDERAISERQDQLLHDLTTAQAKEVKRYRYLPQLVIDVNVDALRYLLTSPQVESVFADAIHSPMQ